MKDTDIQKMIEDYDRLVVYSREIGFDNLTLTVQDLISSHRSQREKIKIFQENNGAEYDAIRQRVHDAAMDYTWIKLDKLRELTIAQLVEMLH